MSIYSKLARASLGVGSLAADKRNEQQRYDYLSADKILERAGKELAEAGLSVVPEIHSADVVTVEYTDSYGKIKTRYDARLGMRMHICEDDGEPLVVDWIGYGVDYASPDKAVSKAITTGHKYFLMKLLNIGIGNEDGEHETAEAPAQRTPQRRTQPAPQPQSTPNGDSGGPMMPTDAQKRRFHASGKQLYGDEWDDKRPELVSAVTGGRTRSSNEITSEEMGKLQAGIDRKQGEIAGAQLFPSNGGGAYHE